MKVTLLDPPREFAAGFGPPVRLRDCGRIELAPDEMVTFVTEAGAQYDLTRKSWGFYATPSLNGRLLGFGLRGVLVRNRIGRCFVLLVERGHEPEFERYLANEALTIDSWLDTDAALARLGGWPTTTIEPAPLRCPCRGERFSPVFTYSEPPAGEVRFAFSQGQPYRRQVLRCESCGHFVSRHAMDVGALYAGAYVNATYSGDGLRRAFERIVALPPEMSDNTGRVRRILEFAIALLAGAGRQQHPPSVLDVGSGLCVFLHRMKAAGWACTALDPDPRAAAHARDVVGISAVSGDFMTREDLGRFDLVTFNKVLEHVEDPVGMLSRSAQLLNPAGFVYVELPDGEAAVHDGPGREEFFIEHHHVFSLASTAVLASRAGFSVATLERLREPSSKYTIRAFLVPPAGVVR